MASTNYYDIINFGIDEHILSCSLIDYAAAVVKADMNQDTPAILIMAMSPRAGWGHPAYIAHKTAIL